MANYRLQSLCEELHPPLTPHEAGVESDRCYFCFDAPCITACPTGIDIPLFIRQIKADNPKGAATTIFNENILGGMCARVCPTETLCEEACVRNTQEEKPVRIGELQRFATDTIMATAEQPYERAAESGKKVAVVGAGPAGLSCAHRLALHGHAVTIFEAKSKPGGLNEFGIAAYKTIEDFAQREVDYVLSIGGIDVEYNKALGTSLSLSDLKNRFDAVFLGMGLDDTNTLNIDGHDIDGVHDAVDFIAELRQSEQPDTLDVGKDVLVIGGGMTAIDAAVQSRLLGADDVTVVYRRDQESMNASAFEQQLAQTHGVLLKTNWQPVRIVADNGTLTGVEFEQTESHNGKLQGTGSTRLFSCDRLLLAIGQQFGAAPALDGVTLENKRIAVDANGRTSDSQIWAGGDCVAGGDDLTVSAVQAGKLAAMSIHDVLSA